MYQPETISKSYSSLFADIEKGIVKIPQFQRDFVWTKEKSAKLIDSIIKGYPIGTFIFWKTKESLRSVKNIGGIEFPPTPKGDFVEFVLDGQQRITSIYACFKGLSIKRNQNDDEYFDKFSEMYVDLSAEGDDDIIVTSTEGRDEGKLLKLCDLLFGDLVYIFKKFPENELVQKIQNYKRQIETYNFTVIKTQEIPIDVATEIFTRLNTGGKPLSSFEIMVAKTYDVETNFDLAEQYDQLIERLSKVGYGSIPDSTVLQVVSMIIKKECKKNVILKLDKAQFLSTWNPAVEAIVTAVEYFRNQYRIRASQILPYYALLVPFAYFFYKHPDKPLGEKQKYLRDFFWRVSLSERYTSGMENKLAQDIKRIDKILKNELPKYDYAPKVSEDDIADNGFFAAGRSYIKAILCIYAYHLPRSFSDNSLVTMDNEWLRQANSKNYHHFFPKSYLKKKDEADFYINHIANITIVDDYLNKREIKAKPPARYMKKFKKENKELAETMRSHLITDLRKFGVWDNNYDKFFEHRIRAIHREMKKRIIPQETDTREILEEAKKPNGSAVIDYDAIVAQGENDKVEFKSSLRWDYKNNQANKAMEAIIAKTICAFMNTDGGRLFIGVDDDGNALGLEKDFTTLGKQNIDGFQLQLVQIINNYLGKEYHAYLINKIIKIQDQDVCLVEIVGSGKPVFMQNEGRQEFYIRASNTSQPMGVKEATDYISSHWLTV